MNLRFLLPRGVLSMLGDIRGNARAMLLFEPMWVVPFSLFSVYASLYMRDLGLSPQQIGLVTSLTMVTSMLGAAVSGHFTDRLGRRRTTLLFDLISWSAATLIWAGAHDFWHFVLAALINGLQTVPAVSWTCLLVEDYEPRERLHIFTALQMVGPLGAFVTPLAGLAIGQLGVVPGTRLLYIFAFLSMTAMFFGRNYFTHESRAGRARTLATQGYRLGDSLRDYGQSLRALLANRGAMAYFILTGLIWFRDGLTLPFSQLLLVDQLGMSERVLALFPAIGGVATLLVPAYALPRLAGREPLGIGWGLGVSAASLAVLLLAPKGSFWAVAFSTLLGAAGTAALIPALNTCWNNALGDQERAKVMAMSNTVWGLIKLPAGYLGGGLYVLAPAWPFVVAMVLLVAGLPLLWLPGTGAGAGVGGEGGGRRVQRRAGAGS